MKKKSLSRNDRGVSHFLNLKKDFEYDIERLSTTLPLFVRIMFIDQPNPWLKEINRFGFIKLASLDNDFGCLNEIIRENIKYCSKISRTGNQFKEISLEIFLQTTILKIDNHIFNVQEFILGIAYNGGLHMQPEKHKNEKYELLYHSLLEPNPEVAMELIVQMTKVFIEIFDEFYSLLVGNNDGHSTNYNFQPLLIENGKELDGIYFRKSYIQFPVRAKRNKGIRICLELKLVKTPVDKSNVVFEYGHSDNENFRVLLYQSGDFLILKVFSLNKTKVMKIAIGEQNFNKFSAIEIAIYPAGQIVVAIDGLTKCTNNLGGNIEIIDGKLILGCNFKGTYFGEFYEKTLTVQSIDRQNNMRVLGAYSLRKINTEPQNIDHRLIKRKFI